VYEPVAPPELFAYSTYDDPVGHADLDVTRVVVTQSNEFAGLKILNPLRALSLKR
jgi:hypothetical protein